MRSHYDPSGVRWIPILAAMVFALVAGLGPVLHFLEDAAAVRTHVPASAGAAHEGGEHPAPRAPSSHTDLDCVFCQILTTPAQAGLAAAPLPAGGTLYGPLLSPHGPADHAVVRVAAARDPPLA